MCIVHSGDSVPVTLCYNPLAPIILPIHCNFYLICVTLCSVLCSTDFAYCLLNDHRF